MPWYEIIILTTKFLFTLTQKDKRYSTLTTILYKSPVSSHRHSCPQFNVPNFDHILWIFSAFFFYVSIQWLIWVLFYDICLAQNVRLFLLFQNDYFGMAQRTVSIPHTNQFNCFVFHCLISMCMHGNVFNLGNGSQSSFKMNNHDA